MEPWIDVRGLGQVLLVGLLAGAGLVTAFSVGLRGLSLSRRAPTEGAPAVGAPRAVGLALAAVGFGLVAAGIALGIASLLAG